MPLPLAAAVPLIAAGVSAAGQAVGGILTGKTNKSTQRYNTKMYERQRADALTDAAMQNEYNSPAAQMDRLTKAGLSPQLAYGQGATTAAPIRSSDAKSYNPQTPHIDTSGVTNSLNSMYDLQKSQQQTDNLAKALEVSNHQIALIDAQTLATLSQVPKNEAETARARQNFDQSSQLFPVSLEGARANVNKTNANTQFTLNQDARNEALTSASIQKTMQDIATQRLQNTKVPLEKQQIAQNVQNLQNSGVLQELDIALRQKGINPNDPAIMRIASRFLDDPTRAVEKAKDILKKIVNLSAEQAAKYLYNLK